MSRTVLRGIAASAAAVLVVSQVLLVVFAGGSNNALAIGEMVAAPSSADEAFRATWARTDEPVLDGRVSRTWMWGPHPNSDVEYEPYAESPGGQRAVLYYDKARMEITHPDGDRSSSWYVTNGLLVVELVTGYVQVGDDIWLQSTPAEMNAAGDPDDPNPPTYRTIGAVLDAPAGEPGTVITERLSRDGAVHVDVAMNRYAVSIAALDDVTNHAIAAPFWDLMNARGSVLAGGQLVEDRLVLDPVYATGRPISEAYWTTVRVGGTPHDVLLQCFERRCLTWTPENEADWQTEAGNVGRHYQAWRATTEVVVPTPTSTSTVTPDATETQEPTTQTPPGEATSAPTWPATWPTRTSTRPPQGTATSTSTQPPVRTATPTSTQPPMSTATPTSTQPPMSTATPTSTQPPMSTATPTSMATATATPRR